MNNYFRKLSAKVSAAVGSAFTFFLALLIVVIWAATGPIFHFSNTWQLVINTGTTIITFLMVFLIQNTQNRDSKAMKLQLDELIESMKTASNAFIDLEDATDDELDRLEKHFREMHEKLELHTQKRRSRR